jgi:hypothetical protein
MRRELNPNDFVDVDEAFEDDYDPDEITLATFTIVPGDQVGHAYLEYNERGHAFLGGSGGPKWAIGLYQGYHYNGQSLPLHDPDEARHVLETLSGTSNLEEYDWAAQDWADFE